MTRLEYEVLIAAPMAEIYAYAANPSNWVEWYPGTTDVEGAPTGPPRVGDTWEETIKIAGMRIRFSWRASEAQAPHAWAIEGRARIQTPFKFVLEGGTATLRHRLDEAEGGTRYRRELAFRYSNPLLRLANQLFLKRKTAAELEEAVQCLKRILEDRASAKAPSNPEREEKQR